MTTVEQQSLYDPSLRSFVAHSEDTDFPIQNLPFGIFRPRSDSPRVGVAIGDYIVDLSVLARRGLIPGVPHDVLSQPSLNGLAALGPASWRVVRSRVSTLLRHDAPLVRDDLALRQAALVPMSKATLDLPFQIPAYTDFYSSEHHASNVGRLFRDKNNPLLPNWKHLPVAYNGRASTVVPSGYPITRPKGQISPGPDQPPVFSPSKKLDFELEIGFFIGVGNSHGSPIPVDQAPSHIFGLVLLNDWSARDHQSWEYVPLGPFLSKSFATSISPWVVSLDALQPFKKTLHEQSPMPLPYLAEKDHVSYDIHLEVLLKTERMTKGDVICKTNMQELYWSMAQQLAHHTINGCRMDIGDLLGTGTISGPEQNSWGSLLEITFNGKEPLTLSSGERRTFLEDGDELTIRGYCQGESYRIGLGSVTGKIVSPT
jgi:fumarylacetoacetase